MRRRPFLLPFLLLAGAPAAFAQEEPPPECPEFAHRNAEGVCACDDGYEWTEDDLQCLMQACPVNAGRPPGQEANPFACECLRGYTWSDDTTECLPWEPCPGDNEIRDEEGSCTCPEHSTSRDDPETDEVETGCDCDEGWEFNADFYNCIPTELQCQANAHLVEIEGDDVNVDGSTQRCVCDEGFHPAPAGVAGCVGEIQVRCQPNAHENPDTGECECNSGYDLTDDERCLWPVVPGPPAEGEGEGEGGMADDETTTDDSLCAVAGPGARSAAGGTWALLGLLVLAWRRQ